MTDLQDFADALRQALEAGDAASIRRIARAAADEPSAALRELLEPQRPGESRARYRLRTGGVE
jgi:hypothetical protein